MQTPRRRNNGSEKVIKVPSQNSLSARHARAMSRASFSQYDTSAIRPKKKGKGPAILAAVLVVLVLGAIGFGIFKFMGVFGGAGGSLPKGEEVAVVITSGSSGAAIGSELEGAQLIGSAREFVKRVTDRKVDNQLKPGTYTFVGGMTIDEIIDKLVEGPGMQGNILTVPEGTKRTAIAARVAEVTNGRISEQDFLDASADASKYASEYSFLAEAGTNSLEGFLYPKTYEIPDSATAETVVRKMLDQFKSEMASVNYKYPEKKGLNSYETLILASIVEKECTPSTAAKVAGVFYNRLNNFGEPNYGFLQSDATTAYTVGHDPTSAEVHDESDPYSTYKHQGLPPTPICSVSLSVMQSVCDPEESDYYFFYFYNDADGYIQYVFSETIDEHNAAIREHS